MDIFFPIQLFADTVTYQWLHLMPQTYWAETIHFFLYDTIKIGLLLVVINYVMSCIRYYFPMEKVRNVLTKRRWYGMDYLFAALLGVVTPFCSCSSIPLFIGFLRAGIPLGVTLSFLISSPLINESSLYLFPALFGLKVTILYNAIGIGVAVVGGMVIQRLGVENYVKTDLLALKSRTFREKDHEDNSVTWKNLALYFWQDGMVITKNIFPYVVLGVAIGALIHGFIPAAVIEAFLSSRSWWAVPLATLLGAPLYANSVSVIPIMEALVGKGVPVGTALAFMTAIVTVSIPEMMILKKVMRWQLLFLFFGITIGGIILMGYILNMVG